MPAFQVALFKLKPDADPALVQEWLAVSRTIPEKIPCVRRLVAGQPAASFEHVAKGWDMAAFIEFDSAESVTEFHGHPAHAYSRELWKQVCDPAQTVAIIFETA